MEPTIQTGSVFARSFSVLTARFGPFVGSVLVIYLPFVAAILVLNTVPPSEGTAAVLSALSLLIFAVLGPLASAAVIRGVFLHLRGEAVHFDDCWRGLGRLWWKILGASILVGVSIVVGFMLCIVPGLIIEAGLFVSIPVLVVEDTGVADALDRSWKLTDGHRLRILFIALGLIVMAGVVGFLVGYLLSVAGLPKTVTDVAIQLAQALMTALQAVVASVVYFDLRELREGLDLDDLASVFD